MAHKGRTRIGLGKTFFWVLLVLLALGVSFMSSKLASYYEGLDNFSFSVRSSDRASSKNNLEVLKQSYVSFSGMGLRYFADKFLFKDMFKYEAATMMVGEDWESAIDVLTGHEDDPYALYMRGVAKYRFLYEAYQSDGAKKDKSVKDEILRRVSEEVRPDFESSVKKDLKVPGNFKAVFDFDLTSDPDATKKAMETPRPSRRFVLGLKPEEGQPAKGRTKRSLPEKRIDDKSPGSGELRKKG